MLALTALLLAMSPTPDTMVTASVCDVGRLALRDLPLIDHNKVYARYYGNADLKSGDVIAACPNLRSEIPRGFPIANSIAIKRASVHVPVRGVSTPLTMIFEVGIPQISGDNRTATVEMGYACTGLCGSGFVANYVRGHDGWRLDGEIRAVFES